jgi:hypothetical protein
MLTSQDSAVNISRRKVHTPTLEEFETLVLKAQPFAENYNP